MDLKDYMQQKVEDPFLSDLSEEAKEYCREVESNYIEEGASKAVKDKRKVWSFFSCAAAILAAAVILICVFVPKKPPLKYLDEKIVSQPSDIDKLNSDSKYFNINLIENATCSFSMSYDSDSGDTLYYESDARGFVEIAHFVIVVNKDYTYSFDFPEGQSVKEPLNGYELNYYPATVIGIDSMQYTGWIQLNTETVYITYTQTPSLGDQAFFTYVQSIIQIK